MIAFLFTKNGKNAGDGWLPLNLSPGVQTVQFRYCNPFRHNTVNTLP